MAGMIIENTELEDVKVITPLYAEDHRGYFLKWFEKEFFAAAGIVFSADETSESSSKRGVLRGLHFQTVCPQAKLVRALWGEIFDVAVDLRKDSPSMGAWVAKILSSENRQALYVPRGFAHGFLVLSEKAIVSYQCDGKYCPQYDSGIRWNDPDIGVAWPVTDGNGVILSDKDAGLMAYRDFIQSYEGLKTTKQEKEVRHAGNQ